MSRRRRTYRGRKAPFKFRKGYNRTSGYYRSNAKAAVEVKFLDNYITSDAETPPSVISGTIGTSFDFHSNGSNVNHVKTNVIIQDTGESDRIGRKILLKSVHVRGLLELNPKVLADDGTDTVRFMFILDKQANGVTFSLADVLGDVTLGQAVFGFKLLANKKRFAILKDFNMTLNTSTNLPGGTQTMRHAKTFECHLTNLNIPVEYNSTTGQMAEVASNHLMLFMVSEHGQVKYKMKTRMRFIG